MPELDLRQCCELCRKLADNVEKALLGKRPAVEAAVLALAANGHILLEDVPGVGKTLLAKALARSTDTTFKRIQFTADLLPSDITGVSVYKQNRDQFSFMPGPIFANILLGDEINRATPRTQSSLLEAMEERQVTVEGASRPIEEPFFVIATQNPIELEGTYPLPFSQMDRFMIRIEIGYPDKQNETRMLKDRRLLDPLLELQPVLNQKQLLEIQKQVRDTKIADELYEYLVNLVAKTRGGDLFEYGASPRATLDLMRYSQAAALFQGRDYVLPDDIKHAAASVLSHRVIVKKGTRLATAGGSERVREVAESVEVPI